ncbi:MAG: hypothetical protein ABL955_03405 [Elusimicrobiota bacterium]
MNKIKLAVLAVCLAVPVIAHEGHKHDQSKDANTAGASKSAADVSVTGELVDMKCYLADGGTGEKHSKCAGACVAGGAPMGLLAKDGRLYLVVGAQSDNKPFVEAKAMAGSAAKLTGKIVVKGGVQALIVTKTEKP